MVYAVIRVILQNENLDLREGRPHREGLIENVDAVAIFFDHPGNPPHLSFETRQPLDGCLLSIFHVGLISSRDMEEPTWGREGSSEPQTTARV